MCHHSKAHSNKIFKNFSNSLFSITFFLASLRILAVYMIFVALTTKTSVIINIIMFSGGRFRLHFDFLFDAEGAIFFACVSWISYCVFSYRKRYMVTDTTQDRFFLLLLSFVFSIFILVFRSNIFRIIIGWDGLGVTSFLLVIYFQNKTSFNAGMITVMTNRIGDVLLLSGIGIMIAMGQWSVFDFSLSLVNKTDFLLLLLLVVGAFTKSAQIPFSSWLPAAIAAPTPVSSLVHSRTLVTAGIFLLLRFKTFFFSVLLYPIIFGCLTICIAGLAGLFERDFKKIVALSTLSQLGLIMARLGLGAFSLTLFHLITHAFFKALLFLATGMRIHSAKDYQDLRLISLPGKASPRTTSIILVSNFRLIGLPFIAGFYSKDLILELLLSRSANPFLVLLFFLGTILTVLYSIRFIFFSRNIYRKTPANFAHFERDFIAFKRYDKLFWLAVRRGSILNWAHLKYAPTLTLTLETKNITFVLIIVTLAAAFFFRTSLLAFNKIIFVKWTLSSIWCIVYLRTRFLKKNVTQMVQTYEKITEKFYLRHVLFYHARNRINSHTQILSAKSLTSFYFIFFAWVFVIFLNR